MLRFKNISLKTLTLAMAFGFVAAVLFSFAGFEAKCNNLRQNVLRLHILAQSDSVEDQALKLKVRDRILKETAGLFETAENKEQALKKAALQLPTLQAIAADELQKNGCNATVRVELEKTQFNTRHYSGFSLPAGPYDAVRVLIGEAKGQNWWCVLFPAMCVPAAENRQELEKSVAPGAAQIAENAQEYKIAFKAVEIYEKLAEKWQQKFGR